MSMNRKEVWSWMFYDFGNSAFATTIMVAVLPVFYKTVAAKNLEEGLALSYWGYTQSAALFIVAVLAPFLGAIADYSGSKKKMLLSLAFMGILASCALALVSEGNYIMASLLTIVGTVGFSGANVFYDAFLPEIAPKDKIDQISSKGFGFGYVGGGILLVINMLMISKWDLFFSSKTAATQVTFITVGLWWLVFTLPLLRNVKERKPAMETYPGNIVLIGLGRIRHTFRDIRKYKILLTFLIAYWLYNDGISTIMKMATIYGSSIGIGTNDLILALVITQFIGIPCTFFIGWIAGKIGPKQTLTMILVVYTFIVCFGYFMTTALHFYLLAAVVGLVQGGAQALSRSIFSSMIPANKHAEFFGFYNISGKLAAIVGPFVFALTNQLFHSERIGILSLILFFVMGMFLLSRIDIDKGRRDVEEAL
ncbi:MFS transporter [Tuberibacillus sp. Marseille-P3662]|uniref:MFS transporter n=1 Tax=Tuberibacillus sp. Marseille-P3662 TaxID=1965358 RepID=UPI0034E8B77A